MKLHKFYSTSCGICGRMSHYDNKVATELGLEFESYKEKTESFNSNSHLLDIVREERGRVGFPAYVVTDDDGNYKGNVMGGYDKGKFREALKQALNGEATTRAPSPGSGDCPYYTMSCSCFCFESTDDSTEKTEYRTSTQESLGGNSIGNLEKIGEYDSTDCSESACQSIDKGDNDYCSCKDNGFPPGPGGTCKLVCYKGSSTPGPGPDPDPDPDPDPTPPAPPPLPPPTVDPVPPGANDGNGNCGWDGCVPTGTVMGGGDFKDTMELVGSDGHKVTYTRINNLEETPIGDSIPGLHPGIVYEYTLKTDCGVSNDGLVNADCEIDHRISMDGRRLEMEDMMLEGTQNYTDLILTLDEGVGTFAKSSATTGTLTMADTCAADEAEGEGEEEDPNISCETSSILTTGYTDPTFFTHAFDPGMIRSVKVINPHDPNGRFLRITIDPHVCDIDSIIDTLCLCTSYDAYGDPIVEFGETTVTKVDDYTIDVVIVGMIIETHGYEG